MSNFILGFVFGILFGIAVCIAFYYIYLKEEKYNYLHKFILFPIIKKEELKDNKQYLLVEKMKYTNKYYIHSSKWKEKVQCFKTFRYYDKYEDVIAVLDENISPIITNYKKV